MYTTSHLPGINQFTLYTSQYGTGRKTIVQVQVGSKKTKGRWKTTLKILDIDAKNADDRIGANKQSMFSIEALEIEAY
jgi:hypothetical protein